MKLANIVKKIAESDDLGMSIQPSIVIKLYDILKKDFPDSDIIKEYPIASAFYHYINSKWKNT